MSGLRISLDGRTALVSGASSGIGAGIARSLATCGAQVVAVGRDAGRLEATIADIRSRGGTAEAVTADLTRDGECERVVAETLERFGALTTLVHSAGLFQVLPLADGLQALDDQWAVNVRSSYVLTQAAMPHLRPGGCVLFVGSIAGRVGFSGGSSYCPTKQAQEGLVRALAIEEAPHGVRVNVLAPGTIDTPMQEPFLSVAETRSALIAATPLRRIGTVQDVAPAAAFLCSDLAGFITGTTLVVDGGWEAQ